MADTIADLLISLGIDANDYQSEIDNVESRMGDLDSRVNKLASTYSNTLVPAIQGAMIAGGIAMAGFVVDSINAAGDFESGMLRFASVTGDSIAAAGFELDDFQAKFLTLGAETSFSAAQAQEAAIALAKGGISVADIMETATAATLDLASAGEIDLANAADIVAKQLGVWEKTGVGAADVSNLLAQAANASTVDVDELANGLLQASGQAKTTGVSFNDMVTTMAMIAPNFSSASEAGTSYKNFLARLLPTSDEAAQAMQKLGWITADGNNQFFDAKGNFIGMEKAADMLQKSTKDLTQEQRSMYLQTIFGNDAMNSAAAIAAGGGDAFREMGADMALAGTAAEQSAKKNQGLNFAIDSLLGSFETFQIIVGSAIIPVITEFINVALIPAVNWISELATMFSNAEDPIFEIVNLFYAFSPLLGDLVGTFLVLIEEGTLANDFFANLPVPVQLVIQAFEWLANIIGANLTPILIGLGIAIGTLVVSAIWGMITAIFTLLAPIMLIVGAVALMYLAYTENFMGIKTLVDTVIMGINTVITEIMGSVLAFWEENGASILNTAKQTWETVYTAVSDIVTAVSGFIKEVFAILLQFWRDNGNDIMAFAKETWDSINEIISGVVTIVRDIVVAAFGTISKFLQDHGEEIRLFLSGAWRGIKIIIGSALDLIKGIINTVLKLIHGDWEGAWNEVKKTVESIWERIKESIGEAATKVWEATKQLGRDIIDGIVQGIKENAVGITDALLGAVLPGYAAARDAINAKSPSRLFADGVGAPISEGVAVGIEEKGKLISDSLTQIVQFAKDSKLTKSVAELASSVVDLFKDTIGLYADLAAMEMATDSAGMRAKLLEISYLIRDAVLDFWNRMREIPEVLKDPKALGIAESVNNVIETVSNAVDAFVKLQDFEGVPRTAIAALMRGIKQAVSLIAEMSTHFEIEGLEQVARFAELVDRILKPITTALQAFDGLRTYKDVASKRMLALASDMRLAIQLMQVLSAEFELEGLEATAKFSDNAKTIFDAIKSGIDALDGIRDYQGVPRKRFMAFNHDFLVAVQLMAQLATKSAEFLVQTLDFAANMQAIAKAIKDAVGAVKDLGTLNLNIQATATFGGSTAAPPAFAAGGITPGGPIIAGEEGFELAMKGNATSLLMGGMYNMPQGVKILPHDKSIDALGLAQENMQQHSEQWNIEPHYTTYQSERSLIEDIRTYRVLKTGLS